MGKSDYCRRCGTVASKLAPGCWPCRIQLALLEVCAVPLIRITKGSTFIGIAMQQCTGIAPPNSVDLEHREGHAHRYHGRAVLKNIARKVGERDKAKAKAVLSRAEPISRGSWPAVSSMMSSRPNGVSVPSQKVTRGSAPVARSCRCCAGCRPGSCATAVTGRVPRGLRAGTIG